MTTQQKPGAAIWTGRIISILVILFNLVDAVMKVAKAKVSVEGSVALQWPENMVMGIGIALLISTILYAIPKTAVLGAILTTAYLGGAVAVMARVNAPFWFAIVFGILTWAGLYLRDPQVRALLPLKK
ncbi:DoxX family protein [Chitinophaga sp. SYP-B3965]|uniref:DoxX family protein n=1 Tax=Chitinophaga sp. SYP-B3965 TaxID=2663120 RepID=UPI001299F344|nr:DoxX family protein [Chitinophaga sp. SYP-B3965]MRG43531.1 DoxX family protein [Chitinophaga sp. SYP-B3965]